MITSIPGFKPVDDGVQAAPTPNVVPQRSDVQAPAPEIIGKVAEKPLIDLPFGVDPLAGPTEAELAVVPPTDDEISAEAAATLAEIADEEAKLAHVQGLRAKLAAIQAAKHPAPAAAPNDMTK